MNYREKTHLARQVFSNAPDPFYFCESRGHVKCLENLSLSIGLRRGLSVVVGGVGTGKTTLGRRLVKMLAEDERMMPHMLSDHFFRNRREFLQTIYEKLSGVEASWDMDEWQLKEAIRRHLFIHCVDKNRIVVFIIDDGQKLPGFCLEVIRELLNLETDNRKLLQIVIAVQGEGKQRTGLQASLSDKIDFFGCLGPFDLNETREMIKQRIEAAFQGSPRSHFFTTAAFWEIHRITGGYPRQVISLAHKCFLDMLINNRRKISRRMVRTCARVGFQVRETKTGWRLMPALTGLIMVLLGLNALSGGGFGTSQPETGERRVKVEAPVTMIEAMRQDYADQVLGKPGGRLQTAGLKHVGPDDPL